MQDTDSQMGADPSLLPDESVAAAETSLACVRGLPLDDVERHHHATVTACTPTAPPLGWTGQ